MRYSTLHFSLLALLSLAASPGWAQDTFQPLRSYTSAAPYDIHAMDTNVDIGNYPNVWSETLVICPQGEPLTSANCNGTYKRSGSADRGGVIIQASKGSTLDFTLKNELAGATAPMPGMGHCMDEHSWSDTKGWQPAMGLTNIHTHGLLVRPDAKRSDGTYGDYVFDCTQKGVTAPPISPEMHFVIDIPSSNEMGTNWFHPHVHGIAKAQLSSGMAGMIAVGTPKQQLCLSPQPDGRCDKYSSNELFEDNVFVRHLLLKDAQIVKKADGQPWLNFANTDPGFCSGAQAPGQLGECTMTTPDPASDLGQVNPVDGRWVYTINGVQYPKWTFDIAGGKTKEVWRLQNASANVTYKISLRALDASGHEIGVKRKFQVVSMDGAGIANPTNSTQPSSTTDELLLMPAARADIYVDASRNDSGANCATLSTGCAAETYQLVTDSFQTGFVKEDADVWPKIALAEINFPQRKAGAIDANNDADIAVMPFMMHKKFSQKSDADLVAEIKQTCMDAQTDATAQQYLNVMRNPGKRRIYFGIYKDNSEESFLLGDTVIQNGVEKRHDGTVIDATHKVEMRKVDMATPLTNLCVMHGSQEEWELVNISKEVHNFHIHQLKFEVDPNTANWRTPSADDTQILPKSIVLHAGAAPLKHDTIIVPRGVSNCFYAVEKSGNQYFIRGGALENPNFPGDPSHNGVCDGSGTNGDGSGKLPISINFVGDHIASPDGRAVKFPFHCHILEHEDAGMMATLTVIDPRKPFKPVADVQFDASLPERVTPQGQLIFKTQKILLPANP